MSKVCVFAGARGGQELLPAAEQCGKLLAQAGYHVLFGGSSKGVMGALTRGVLTEGGKITGILPASIASLKHYRDDIEIVVTADMPTRKAHFWECDAFLCLPGGFGTLDELFEIATETKLGHQDQRPIVVLNDGGFYDHLKALIDRMVWSGTMPRERANLVKFTRTPAEAIAALAIPGQDHNPEIP